MQGWHGPLAPGGGDVGRDQRRLIGPSFQETSVLGKPGHRLGPRCRSFDQNFFPARHSHKQETLLLLEKLCGRDLKLASNSATTEAILQFRQKKLLASVFRPYLTPLQMQPGFSSGRPSRLRVSIGWHASMDGRQCATNRKIVGAGAGQPASALPLAAKECAAPTDRVRRLQYSQNNPQHFCILNPSPQQILPLKIRSRKKCCL